MRLKYIGDRSIVIPYGGVQRRIQPGEEFATKSEHLAKMGYFVEVGNDKNVIQSNIKTTKVNNIPERLNKKYRPFVGYSKMKRSSIPKVSICIVSKDGDGVIQRCIKGIVDNVRYKNYEILICDTGTTDRNVLDYYSTIDNQKNISIFHGHTYNFSKNNNYLVNQSTGEVVLFLNNDVFMTYDALSEMMKYNNISSLGCVGHRLVFDRDKNIIQHDGQTLYNTQGQWTQLGHHNIMHNIRNVSNKNAIVEGVTAACLMMDKSIFNEVGGFDEGYVDILQDVDLNLKVGKLGYKNYCIRDKSIIHVDHFSRKGDETKESPKDLQKYLNDWVYKGNFPVVYNTNYSVLIVGTKESELVKVNKSIKSTVPYEFAFYNNKGNFSFSGQALNLLSDVSTSKYQFLTHQDIEFKENEPFLKLDNITKVLGDDWGVLGIAGVKLINGQITGYNYFEHRYPQSFFPVDTVDEFAMIVDKDKGLRFDESLVGFHFYGADICLHAENKGLKNYTVDINIFHHSGGDGNLTYNKNQGWKEFKELGKQVYKLYSDTHKNYSTTTTLFTRLDKHTVQINYFIGSVIDKIPNSEVIETIKI